jgi:3-hydroxybutyryl-CoA dehydratase
MATTIDAVDTDAPQDGGGPVERTLDAWRGAMDDAAAVYRALAGPPPARAYPHGRTIAELAVGDAASMTKAFSQSDIDGFARVSGDANPVHLDREYAEASFFKGRIAHGVLTAGLISAVIGMDLPGPGTIYLSQTLRGRAPVRPGDRLTATVTVKEVVAEKNRVVLDTVVTRDGEPVLTGEALVMPPAA